MVNSIKTLLVKNAGLLMKKIIIGLIALTSISAFASTENCSLKVSSEIKEHQSFIGLIDDSDEYVPARLEVTTLTLNKEGNEIHSEKLKLRSLDYLVSSRRAKNWANACAEAVYNLNVKAVHEGCDSKVLEEISNIKCEF